MQSALVKKTLKHFDLQPITYSEWRRLSMEASFSPLVQSWQYGDAKAKQGWIAHRFRIHADGIDIGIIQVLEKKIFFFGGVAQINRGPIFLHSYLQDSKVDADYSGIWNALKKLARKKRWWYVAAMPEYYKHETSQFDFRKIGLRSIRNKEAWGSYRVSLDKSVDDLFMGLKGKWRNLLKKSLKADCEIHLVNEEEYMQLLVCYREFQQQAGFTGVPESLLVSMFQHKMTNEWNYRVLVARENETKELLAFVIVTEHGDTANYLIGWSSNEGRRLSLNYRLLWLGIQQAKERGLKWFDLGGVTKNTPKGIAHFKEGLNGEHYQLYGNFWFSFF